MYFIEALLATAKSILMYIVFRFLITKFVTKESFGLFNSKDLIAVGIFAAIVFPINYYFIDSVQQSADQKTVAQSVVTGQSFAAPELQTVQKPLALDIETAVVSAQEPKLTEVVTNQAKYTFSTRGASLESMDLLWQQGKTLVPVVKTAVPSCVVGMLGKSPADYELINVSENDQLQAYVIEYRGTVDQGEVYKAFVIYKDNYRIDVKVKLKGFSGDQQLRLFVSSPVLSEEVKAVVNKVGSQGGSKLQDINLSKSTTFNEFWFEPQLFGFTTKFLTSICIESTPLAVGRAYLKKLQDETYQAIIESKMVHDDQEISWSLYVGPKSAEALVKVAPELASLMQYGWLTPIAKPGMQLMNFLHDKTGSYGWAIILLALLIKLILLPFTLKGEKSLKQQAEFDKKRAYLQQKYKHDKAALDEAMAELINKHGLPMLSGCLPMLINIPIFLALNKVLSSAIELHGASFAWLPDLSVVDPYYILSILVFVAMVASPIATVDPRQWASRLGFALFLAAVTAYLSSGLAMFIMLNTVLGVAQTWIVRKMKWIA